MAAIKKVAIAGATGNLGTPVTAELVKAGFEVTALTRDASKIKLPQGVRAASIDYTSLESIKAALQGQDALVSTLSGPGETSQRLLVDAAIAVGVKRILPSEFGSDHTNPDARSLPVYRPKVEMEDYLAEAVKGTATSYTIVTTNAFLDWGITTGFLINAKEKKAIAFDGGDVSFTAAPLAWIGQAVVGILRNLDATANRDIKVHGAALTINRLVDIAQEQTGKDGWTIEQWDTREKLTAAYATLQEQPANFLAWGFPMIYRAGLGQGMITDYTDNNQNDLLGIKALTDAEVHEICTDSFKKALEAL